MAAILVYHRVAETDTDVHGLCVPPVIFRSQVDHVQRRYDVMPLDDLVQAVRRGRVPARAVAITFDDGYVDNFTHASPILSELGVPATFFITTDRLDETYEYWWDVVERIFLCPTPTLPPSLNIELPVGHVSLPTNSAEDRRQAHTVVHRALLDAPAELRDHAMGCLTQWSSYEAATDPAHRRMNGGEVVALSGRPGHTIGAHSVRHVALPKQTPTVQEAELHNSRDQLQSLTGQRVVAFAYPFGAADEETCAIASRWFECALATGGGDLTKESPIYRLPRSEVRMDLAIPFDEWLHRSVGQ
jgi:peptidoglycan/xylan/chitin deacetylase (PgdA/CDA1 family)